MTSTWRSRAELAHQVTLLAKQGDEDHWAHGYGFYHETCEKRDGEWLFTFRSLKRTHLMTSPGAKMGADRVAARSQTA